jgi:hypothetical protein
MWVRGDPSPQQRKTWLLVRLDDRKLFPECSPLVFPGQQEQWRPPILGGWVGKRRLEEGELVSQPVREGWGWGRRGGLWEHLSPLGLTEHEFKVVAELTAL